MSGVAVVEDIAHKAALRSGIQSAGCNHDHPVQRLGVDTHGQEPLTQDGTDNGHTAGGGVHNSRHQHGGNAGDQQGIAVQIEDKVCNFLESRCRGDHSTVARCGGSPENTLSCTSALISFRLWGICLK